MGERIIIQSIGSIDSRAPQVHAGTQGGAGTRECAQDKTHGDIVVDAITWPTRFLMAGVMVVNLSLGAWLIQRADFSSVRPQGGTPETPAESALPHVDLPMAAARPTDGGARPKRYFALNERK